MGIFNNDDNYDSGIQLPFGVKMLLFICFLLFLGWISPKEQTFVCKGQYSFCTMESRNHFNMPKSEPVLMPKDVTLFAVDDYQKDVLVRDYGDSRDYRRETRYLIRLGDDSGKTVKIFDDYTDYARAVEVQKAIKECVKHGPYPCKVKR